MAKYSKIARLQNQSCNNHCSDLTCNHSVNTNSSIQEWEKACSLPKVMTDDELINNLFPEPISSFSKELSD